MSAKLGTAVAVAAGVFLLSRKAGGKPSGTPGNTLSRADLEALATSVAIRRGCPPVALLATVDVESAWNPDASNLTGGDGARGGSYGLAQVSYQTALELEKRYPTRWSDDPTLPPWNLLDPEINLSLAASLHAENASRCTGDHMSNVWLSDLAALYNSGKPFSRAPVSTRTYVQKYLASVRSRMGAV